MFDRRPVHFMHFAIRAESKRQMLVHALTVTRTSMSFMWKLFTVSEDIKFAKVNCGTVATKTFVTNKPTQTLKSPEHSWAQTLSGSWQTKSGWKVSGAQSQPQASSFAMSKALAVIWSSWHVVKHPEMYWKLFKYLTFVLLHKCAVPAFCLTK